MSAYLLLIAGILLWQHIAKNLVFDLTAYSSLIGAGLMLCIPSIIDHKNADSLKFNLRGFLTGAVVSIVILSTYVGFLQLFCLYWGKTVRFTEPNLLLMLTHLIVYAFPEEFFFRGYMQRKMGSGWRAIVTTSFFFAMAHLIVICLFSSNGNVCIQNILTFFPSIVMGYLYMRTGTLWSSVFFHFAANIVYISVRMV